MLIIQNMTDFQNLKLIIIKRKILYYFYSFTKMFGRKKSAFKIVDDKHI